MILVLHAEQFATWIFIQFQSFLWMFKSLWYFSWAIFFRWPTYVNYGSMIFSFKDFKKKVSLFSSVNLCPTQIVRLALTCHCQLKYYHNKSWNYILKWQLKLRTWFPEGLQALSYMETKSEKMKRKEKWIGKLTTVLQSHSHLHLSFPQVIFKLDTAGNALEIDQSRLNRAVKMGTFFSVDKFRHMCILAGCDYLPSLQGIGLGKARKFMHTCTNTDMRQVTVGPGSNVLNNVTYFERVVIADHIFLSVRMCACKSMPWLYEVKTPCCLVHMQTAVECSLEFGCISSECSHIWQNNQITW